MAEVCDDHEIVTKFLIQTCTDIRLLNFDDLNTFYHNATIATLRASPHHHETDIIPLTTGSVAEFYIQPMLSCVGDRDIMCHLSDELAIPAGTAPPTQLPDEFHSRVEVFEIVDSEFPGYVYLVSSYLLTECIDDGKYNAVQCQRQYGECEAADNRHGPASMTWLSVLHHQQRTLSIDLVKLRVVLSVCLSVCLCLYVHVCLCLCVLHA